MKQIVASQILHICIAATVSMPILPQQARSQLPPIVDSTTPVPKETSNNTNTAAVAKLEVRCQNLKTIVKKGDRQATMMTWTTNYFGREFSNEKRCQIVSERLQKAANINGGTFQGVRLASGTVNLQTVICALQNGSKKCSRDNFLFTLKPENANHPQAVIQQILSFAEDGSSSVNEGATTRSTVDLNLGNWERKAFAKSQFSTNNSRDNKKGF
jgi:osmotically-inducible protein OsmY